MQKASRENKACTTTSMHEATLALLITIPNYHVYKMHANCHESIRVSPLHALHGSLVATAPSPLHSCSHISTIACLITLVSHSITNPQQTPITFPTIQCHCCFSSRKPPSKIASDLVLNLTQKCVFRSIAESYRSRRKLKLELR